MSLTLKPVLGCNLQCSGCYETEVFRLKGNRPAPYDLDAVIETMRQFPPGPAVLHGGEITLMPVPDIRRICEAAREQGRQITIQTNATIITKALLELLVEFKVFVGTSLNGPDVLNRDRVIVDLAATDRTTERIHRNIEALREIGLEVGVITVLSKTNAGDDGKLARLIDWARDFGERLGIWYWRWNPLHDKSALDIELTAEQAAHAYEVLADACFADPRRIWNPFREFVDNLWGLGIQPCWMSPCDVYSTAAVDAVFGDGSRGNCLRTAGEGIPYLRDHKTEDLRQQILSQVAVEDGGCRGCRYQRVCAGGCPGEAFDDDWRNKSRFCEMYYRTYQFIEGRLLGLMPNFAPLPDWRTDNEAWLMQHVMNRTPPVSPINPMNPQWSQKPSTYEQSARFQRR
jgi:uncharacterized protein